MNLTIDIEKGERVANLLYNAFSTMGIHGRTDMPEDVLPEGMARGSLEHVLFITLTVSIDYQRDAPSLWKSSRRTFEDPKTRYLFSPRSLHEVPLERIIKDLQKHKLSKKPRKDAHIWKTVGVTFYKKWNSDPRDFLRSCNRDAPIVLKRLREDEHLYAGREVSDYPYLRGNKIGPLWLRMLRDNVGIEELKNLDKVPIPVDTHVARATLMVGVVRGQFSGRLNELFKYIREAWFESVKGLNVKRRPMIALDVDEPLWHLSKYGCSNRDKKTGYCPMRYRCEAKEFCVGGRIMIEKGYVEVDT